MTACNYPTYESKPPVNIASRDIAAYIADVDEAMLLGGVNELSSNVFLVDIRSGYIDDGNSGRGRHFGFYGVGTLF